MQGQRARFHIFTLGTEDDLHSPSLQAATFVADVRLCTVPPAFSKATCAAFHEEFLAHQLVQSSMQVIPWSSGALQGVLRGAWKQSF